MSMETRDLTQEVAASRAGAEVFSDGYNKIVSARLSAEQFLATEDERMQSLIELYNEHRRDGQAPAASAITPEKLFATGMLRRTHCLHIRPPENSIQFAVWAEGANFDGFRSMQNAQFDDLSNYGVMQDALLRQLEDVLAAGEPCFYEVRGLLNDYYYYFTKAVLPLRSEEGQIVKCLVPFTDKLPQVPSDLREEFCLADIDEK